MGSFWYSDFEKYAILYHKQNIFRDFQFYCKTLSGALPVCGSSPLRFPALLLDRKDRFDWTLLKRSNYICNELFTWADVYDTANHDERRAILQQFIKEIRVRKDYEISITLNASFNQVEQLKSVSIYDGAEIFEEISEKGA